MSISAADRGIIRRLAGEVAEIAALPCHQQTADLWRRLNDRQPVRPMVWINELPWHELNVDDELTLCCEDSFCRGVEGQLRATLYEWRHLPADMIVEPWFANPLVIRDSGFGIHQEGRLLSQGEAGAIYSHEFAKQIHTLADVAKIRDPELSLDEEATARGHAALDSLLGDLLPVRDLGVVHVWFAPWDELIRWYGVEPAMLDLAINPELVHACMDRLVGAYLSRLRQWRELGVLDQTAGNYRVGSGGLGYISGLPQHAGPRQVVGTQDQWGCATAQIFSEVSPAMHEAFALQYERRWLAEFGVTYYGCCEPLHLKLGILDSVPNLRKISMSPKADMASAVDQVGDRYVLSHKPNPAVFAWDHWDLDQARRALTEELAKAQGVAVEIIMKDVSTLRHEPRRVWEWARMAKDVAEGLS
ncbi:MAG: hypothetical protein HZB16_18840 [Armatimonadetes bacterium]|nr:hypothetical protein [Armatimonadota bacterium]